MSSARKTFAPSRLGLLFGATFLPVLGAAAIGAAIVPDSGFLVSSAQAQEGHGQGGGQGHGQGGGHDSLLNLRGQGQGAGGQGQGHMGGSLESGIFRDDGGERGMGQGQGQGQGQSQGQSGGGQGSGGGGKGGDYGDIVIVLRDDAGNPILDENGNIQPCLVAGCTEDDPTTYTQLVESEEGDFELPDGVIPVEFGRLNVARSPDSVIEHSLAELLAKFDGTSIDSLEQLIAGTDASGRLIDADGNTIDSPLENFALYVALLEAVEADPDASSYTLSVSTDPHGDEPPESFSMTVSADLVPTLAAAAFAAASDKTGDLTVDEIMGITGFVELDGALSSLVDSSDYSYDRAALYDGVMVTVLQESTVDETIGGEDINGDGEITSNALVYTTADVNLYEAVSFNDVPSIDDDGNGIDTFTQQADDAVQVLEFVHDYAID
ncbi:hypothetical protein [Halomonas getboli]|uniref:hypothetical protein n=1 Tax=Halomonas getboli TaxID=2935862 RepID=UPI001FFF9E4E|nr:hypothetical protein [Halomonas getboli]MCK2184714.1 hypothetical protein [Halomonas getboli]